MLPNPEAARLREGGMPVVVWTVRSPAQWDQVKDCCDNLIFEGFSA
jgi:glycerophosphoryl diester phosphodiesterase